MGHNCDFLILLRVGLQKLLYFPASLTDVHRGLVDESLRHQLQDHFVLLAMRLVLVLGQDLPILLLVFFRVVVEEPEITLLADQIEIVMRESLLLPLNFQTQITRRPKSLRQHRLHKDRNLPAPKQMMASLQSPLQRRNQYNIRLQLLNNLLPSLQTLPPTFLRDRTINKVRVILDSGQELGVLAQLLPDVGQIVFLTEIVRGDVEQRFCVSDEIDFCVVHF